MKTSLLEYNLTELKGVMESLGEKSYRAGQIIKALHMGLDFSEMEKYYSDKLFSTTIPRNVTLSEAPGFGMPVYYHDKRSKGAKEYLAVAKELASRI